MDRRPTPDISERPSTPSMGMVARFITRRIAASPLSLCARMSYGIWSGAPPCP